KTPIGFGREVGDGQDSYADNEAITKTFAPEFRNRLDAIVPFQNLTQKTVEKVVEKFVAALEGQLADKNIEIVLSDKARKHLAVEGYDPAMGARPLGRIIQEQIKRPLAEEILFGKLENGGTVKVDIKDGKMVFDYKAVKAKKPKPSKDSESESVE
ncbi:MAG: ATP-dependent Clp protease ATP-binding subunit ClpA, partial [Pseudomonadota bacterium]